MDLDNVNDKKCYEIKVNETQTAVATLTLRKDESNQTGDGNEEEDADNGDDGAKGKEDKVAEESARQPDGRQSQRLVVVELVRSRQQIPRLQLLRGKAFRHLVVDDRLNASTGKVRDGKKV